MANTYTYADALNFIRSQVPSVAEEQKASAMCNIGTNLIWNAFDWRETVAELPPFWLSPNVQDYGAPFTAVPADFLGLREAQLVDIFSVPPVKTPLKVLRFLEDTHVPALPHAISYEPSQSSFRVFPRVPPGIPGGRYKINGIYKKRPTFITSSNYTSTLLPFDDIYFNVWLEVLRWAAYSATGDQRAGEVQIGSSGRYQLSGQLAKAHQAIIEMAENEGMNLGDSTVAPAEPLVSGIFLDLGI